MFLDSIEFYGIPMSKKQNLGQFFTTSQLLQDVISKFTLIKSGTLLEPSIGEGDLLGSIKKRKIVGCEIDPTVYPKSCFFEKNIDANINHGCFFEQAKEMKNISSVVSNPPYVKWSCYKKESVPSESLIKLKEEVNMPTNGNLAYLFMYQCIKTLKNKGEMIFLVPKDFTSATSASFLRKALKENGNITHWMEGREDKFFEDADLENLCIFRWVKETPEKNLKVKYYQSASLVLCRQFEARKQSFLGDSNVMYLIPENYSNLLTKSLGDYFDIKVGSVSGKEDIYKNPPFKSKNTVSLHTSYNTKEDYLYVDKDTVLTYQEKEFLSKYKEELVQRYGSTEENYQQWSSIRNKGISVLKSSKKILIQTKTREKKPFFLGDEDGFNGSLYAFVSNNEEISEKDLSHLIKILNSDLYRSILSSNGMGSPNGRGVKLKLIPKSLESLPLPSIEEWEKYSISLNMNYHNYRDLGRKVLSSIGEQIFQIIKEDDWQEMIEVDNKLSDDGRNISAILDKKFHAFLGKSIIKERIIKYINSVVLTGNSVCVNDIIMAPKREWFDFSIEMDNGFSYYINTKHTNGKKSQSDNVSGNKSMLSYLLSGNPDSDAKAKNWDEVLYGALMSLKNSLPNAGYVDYFILEIIKNSENSYHDFNVFSILDEGAVRVNKAQGMPGLQFSSSKAEVSVLNEIEAKIKSISWCRDWILGWEPIRNIIFDIDKIIVDQNLQSEDYKLIA